MSDDMDWLSALVAGGDDEAEAQRPPDDTPAAVTSEPASPASESEPEMDLVDDLRNEIATEEEALVVEAQQRTRRSFGGLKPAQLFVLSVLLFLDVVVIGTLILVMTGRIVLPI